MRDIKYIIKRIIIGVGIALVLMYLKGGIALQVHANQISPYNSLGYSEDINSGYASVDWDVPGDPWKSHGNGILRFSFGITKTSGSSTDPILTPRLVRAYNGSTAYVCNFGSTTTNNSTWTGQSFSVECPMNMDSNGLTEILIAFIPFSQNSSSTFKLSIPPDMSFEVFDSTNVQVNVDTSATTSAINNQITNDNSNTQNIINNDNQNTQAIIDSTQVCKTQIYNSSNVSTSPGWLGASGEVNNSDSYSYTTDYIDISKSSNITIFNAYGNNPSYCLYNSSKEKLSCTAYQLGSTTGDINVSITNNVKYIRFSIRNDRNTSISFEKCGNGNQAIADGQQQINDTLNNDNVDGASDVAESFFDDFQSDSHGLSGIITAPLRLITSLSSSTCTSLSIPLPFVQNNATLPCMSTIYSTYFPTFLTLYQLITTGLIGYWVLIKIFGHVKGMQDPKDDRIEVLDL